jgi:hypothetical protein
VNNKCKLIINVIFKNLFIWNIICGTGATLQDYWYNPELHYRITDTIRSYITGLLIQSGATLQDYWYNKTTVHILYTVNLLLFASYKGSYLCSHLTSQKCVAEKNNYLIMKGVCCRIAQCHTSGQDSAYCAFARDNFNYAVDEWAMKWRDWEPNRYTLPGSTTVCCWWEGHEMEGMGI